MLISCIQSSQENAPSNGSFVRSNLIAHTPHIYKRAWTCNVFTYGVRSLRLLPGSKPHALVGVSITTADHMLYIPQMSGFNVFSQAMTPTSTFVVLVSTQRLGSKPIPALQGTPHVPQHLSVAQLTEMMIFPRQDSNLLRH